MNRFLKPGVWIPMLLGVLAGLILFITGEQEDAPGLVVIGCIVASVLIFYGISNAVSPDRRGLILAILLFCLCAFGLLWIVMLAIEGEFAGAPGVLIVAGAICVGLLVAGFCALQRYRRR